MGDPGLGDPGNPRPGQPDTGVGHEEPWRPAETTVQRIRELRQELAGPSSDERRSAASSKRSWMRPLGAVLMVISGLFIPAAFGSGAPVALAIPGFLAGLILFSGQRFTLRR